ncbi:hypothetical protein [Streptomyces sp. SID14515]|uniref:hypothetical protein n=1 Tax=Streptomyces sp. SID14515 TaxID=2706074 RepID=UPI0013CD1796|nr:hypothetical protein [Streptomyces sp. SID14515]NEB42331.1 hypothetical protein [Streptomyces sp. SID14515]
MTTDPSTQLEVIRGAVARHIAHALVSNVHSRARAARDLAHELDNNWANIDDLVDQHLISDGYSTAEVRRESANETPDPWGPGVTRDQAMANVVTLHLAEALLDGKSEEVRTWARGLAHELKRERIDLIDDIGRHMQRMALGGPTNEIPF